MELSNNWLFICNNFGNNNFASNNSQRNNNRPFNNRNNGEGAFGGRKPLDNRGIEKNIKDKNSILNNYSKLLAVRNEYGADLITAKYKFYRKGGVVGYKIKTANFILEVVANITNTIKPIKLDNAKLLYSNLDLENSLKPYQFVILKRSR